MADVTSVPQRSLDEAKRNPDYNFTKLTQRLPIERLTRDSL